MCNNERLQKNVEPLENRGRERWCTRYSDAGAGMSLMDFSTYILIYLFFVQSSKDSYMDLGLGQLRHRNGMTEKYNRQHKRRHLTRR